MLPKLITYTRGFIPLSHIYFIIKAMNEMASELNETKAKIIAYAHHGKKTWWSWSEQEMNTLGKLIWKKTATKKTAEEHFQKIRSFAEKSIETAEKLRKKNLAILSNEQLPKAYQEFYERWDNTVYNWYYLSNILKEAIPTFYGFSFGVGYVLEKFDIDFGYEFAVRSYETTANDRYDEDLQRFAVTTRVRW